MKMCEKLLINNTRRMYYVALSRIQLVSFCISMHITGRFLWGEKKLAFNFSSVLKTGEEALDREKRLDTRAVIRGSQGYEMEKGKKP